MPALINSCINLTVYSLPAFLKSSGLSPYLAISSAKSRGIELPLETDANRGFLLQNRHNTDINGYGDTCLADFVHPPFILFHIIAELCHNEFCPGILLHAQVSDVRLEGRGFKMLFRVAGCGNCKPGEINADKLHQFICIIKITPGALPAFGEVSPQDKNVIYAKGKIILHFRPDFLPAVADAGIMVFLLCLMARQISTLRPAFVPPAP